MTEIEDRSGAASPELERIAGDAVPITDENGAIEAGDDLESEAVSTLEDLEPEDQAEILEAPPPAARVQ